jgi:hypothetical protein
MSENVKAVKRMVQRAALEHACPRCLRQAGNPCVTQSRGTPMVVSERKKAHAKRVELAFEAGTIKIK